MSCILFYFSPIFTDSFYLYFLFTVFHVCCLFLNKLTIKAQKPRFRVKKVENSEGGNIVNDMGI